MDSEANHEMQTHPLMRRILASPLARFLGIGVLSTAAYALLVLMLLGVLDSSLANLVALAVTAVANTAANRRLTFGVRGRTGLVRQYAGSALVFLLALGITDGALALLDRYDSRPSRVADLSVLVAATLVATVCRFVALRAFVFTGVGTQASVTAG